MQFVTAYLHGTREPRQGWLVNPRDKQIVGQGGTVYHIEGQATLVTNPPLASQAAKDVIQAMRGVE